MASKTSPPLHRNFIITDTGPQRNGIAHSTGKALAAEIPYQRGILAGMAADLSIEVSRFHNRCVDLITLCRTAEPNSLAQLALSLEARAQSAHNSVQLFQIAVQKLINLSKAPPL